jgi:hypothetical protein
MVKFKASKSKLVKEVGSITVDIIADLFHEFVKEEIKEVKQDKTIDVSLLRLLSNKLENSLVKNGDVIDEKIDKKKLVLDEYIKLKPQANNPNDVITLETLLEDLHNTKQIKKVSKKRKFIKWIKELFKKE